MEAAAAAAAKGRGNRIVEENFLAIFEADDCRDTRDNNDNRIAFLEAVRSSCLATENGSPPSFKMWEAVYQFMRAGNSLEMIMESFWLLRELDKRFLRTCLRNVSESEEPQLVTAEEVWTPFVLNLDKEVVDKDSSKPLDSLGFHQLVQELAKVAEIESPEIESLRSMLLFQYLLDVLEGDFMPRNKLFEETSSWIPLKESLLSVLLNSRKIRHKILIKDCLAAFCRLFRSSAASEADDLDATKDDVEADDLDATKDDVESESTAALAIVWAEVIQNTCTALQKLLVMMMELDVSRKKAEADGSITRADGTRTPWFEQILEELMYDSDMLSPFLQIFNEPKWKTELIFQYFLKYVAKPSVRTRRTNSNGSPEVQTISGILKGFSNVTSSKSIVKKIGADTIQLLIAHAFKAHLSLGTTESSVAGMCEDVITAFTGLKTANQELEILPIGKEALFTASMILSSNT